MNKKDHAPGMDGNSLAIAGLNKVSGFDPSKFLRRVVSPENGKETWDMDVSYKKLWFRLANPNGRIRLNRLHLTEQIAIYEAQVYLNRDDANPVSNFTASCTRTEACGEGYIQKAQQKAMDEALSNAGFGPLFVDRGAESVKAETPPPAKAVQEQPKMPAQANAPAQQTAAVQAAIKRPINLNVPAAPERTAIVPQEKSLPIAGPAKEKENVQEAIQSAMAMFGKQNPADAAKASVENNKTVSLKMTNPPQNLPVSGSGEQPDALSKYTESMPMEEILKQMTLEEAEAVIVSSGTCKGWTMKDVAERRIASLKFYVYGDYKGSSNIVRAAAQILWKEKVKAG